MADEYGPRVCADCTERVLSDPKKPKQYEAHFHYDHRTREGTVTHATCEHERHAR